MMKIKITLVGTSELVMHNVRLADPLDPIVQSQSEITSKKDKTDADQVAVSKLQFMGGLYVAGDGKTVIMPAQNIQRCLTKAAVIRRQGKAVERALIIGDPYFPVIYPGHQQATPEKLWDNPNHRHSAMVRVGQSRVPRMRPQFPEWTIEAEFLFMEDALDLTALERIVREAGFIEGLGDHRTKGSGRFNGKVEVLQKNVLEGMEEAA